MEKTRLEVQAKIEAAKPFIQGQTTVVNPVSGLSLDFIQYNPHPKGYRVKDCVKRAITVATGFDYKRIKTILVEEARRMSYNPYNFTFKFNHEPVFSKVLHAFDFKTLVTLKGKTLFEVSKLIPKGIAVVCSNKHVATLIDGKLYDSWFSGDMKATNIYVKHYELDYNAKLTNDVKPNQYIRVSSNFEKGGY